MNCVIVSGGLQTRFDELSCFPKILLPSTSGKSILMEQMKYFESIGNIYIVVNKKFEHIMKAYIKANNLLIDVIVSDNTNGSGNTLASVYNKLPQKDVLFFWSDILFENDNFTIDPKIDVDKNNCVIFTTKDNKFRYKIDNGKIVNRTVSYDGNVPGIFWIKDISRIIPKEPISENKDLIDLIEEKVNEGMVTFTESNIDTSIIEYKSLNEYKKLMNDANIDKKVLSGDLNIIYNDNMDILSIASTSKEKDILEYQEDWENTIKHLSDNCYNYYVHMPIEDKDYKLICQMFNLEGYNVYSNIPEKETNKIVKNLGMYKYHVPTSSNVKYILNEYVSKPMIAFARISELLHNSVTFDEINNLVEKCCIVIIDNTSNDWVFTHGNLCSNSIFINSVDCIRLINPRKRNGDNFYCPDIVDISEAKLASLGIVDKLRDFMIYKTDELPEIPEEIDTRIKIAMLLHLMGMLTEFSDDIMKINILFDYILVNLDKIVSKINRNE